MEAETYYTPCVRCSRKHTETALKLHQGFHICSDALSCLRSIKAQQAHTFAHGVATARQRGFALSLVTERNIDLTAFIRTELGLDDAVKVSAKAMSAIIQGLMSKQIKAAKAA
jgi:hypothetical protein